eukprot:JP448378.1.p1 GENE.JP448378.1~~JP448378.1.p1  ORF type:complete len:132 (+),score=37.68 JP448378.1:27-422(+)
MLRFVRTAAVAARAVQQPTFTLGLQNTNVSMMQMFSAQPRSFAAAAGTFLNKDEVTERVVNVVKNFQKVDPTKVSPTAHFSNDLGLDSLDAVELVMAFEDEFVIEISDSEAEKIHSTEDAINFISTHPNAK